MRFKNHCFYIYFHFTRHQNSFWDLLVVFTFHSLLRSFSLGFFFQKYGLENIQKERKDHLQLRWGKKIYFYKLHAK